MNIVIANKTFSYTVTNEDGSKSTVKFSKGQNYTFFYLMSEVENPYRLKLEGYNVEYGDNRYIEIDINTFNNNFRVID